MNKPEHADIEEHLADLAALVQGRLPESRHERVEQLLAESPRAYEVVADSIRFMEYRRRRRQKRVLQGGALALAAGVAGLVAVVGLSERGDNPLLREAPAQIASSAPALADRYPNWSIPPWSATRGPEDGLIGHELEFRVGARLSELRVALALQDSAGIHSIVRDLRRHFGAIPFSEPVDLRFARLDSALARESDPVTRRRLADAAATELQAFLGGSAYFSLGQLAEIARLGVMTGETAIVQTSGLEDGVRELAEEDDLTSVRPLLEEWLAVLDSGVSDQELPTLSEVLDRMYRELGR